MTDEVKRIYEFCKEQEAVYEASIEENGTIREICDAVAESYRCVQLFIENMEKEAEAK